jgi:endonuclease YncB( thermonuclease family)
MSGPISASLSFAGKRKRAAAAIVQKVRGHGTRDRSGRFALLVYLACTALAGGLCAAAFLGLAGFLLIYPTAKPGATPGALAQTRDTFAAAAVLAPDAPHRTKAAPASVQRPAPERVPAAEPAPAIGASLDRPEQNREGPASKPRVAAAAAVAGPVGGARDGMTWVIAGEVVHLWGVRAAPRTPTSALADLTRTISAHGPVSCRRQPHSTRYRCATANGEDLAELSLAAGLGRAAEGAGAAYHAAEAQARNQHRVIWAAAEARMLATAAHR